MEISNRMKGFLRRGDIKDAIQRHDFKYVYNTIERLIDPYGEVGHFTSNFTELLLEIDVNPLEYMDKIPAYFLYYSYLDLNNFYIPDHIKYIGDYAFKSCKTLISITIPDGVEEIGNYTFIDCHELTSVTLPSSLKSLGASIFRGCENLKTIYYEGSKKEWESIDIGTYSIPRDIKLIFNKEN